MTQSDKINHNNTVTMKSLPWHSQICNQPIRSCVYQPDPYIYIANYHTFLECFGSISDKFFLGSMERPSEAEIMSKHTRKKYLLYPNSSDHENMAISGQWLDMAGFQGSSTDSFHMFQSTYWLEYGCHVTTSLLSWGKQFISSYKLRCSSLVVLQAARALLLSLHWTAWKAWSLFYMYQN